MPHLLPDHRFREVQGLVAGQGPVPSDSFLATLYALLKEGACTDQVTTYAYELYANPDHRPVVDAFILALMDRSEIAKTLGIPEDVLVRYAYFFMDIDVFRNKLELISFARVYESNEYGKELVRTAVTVGPEYLLWAYGTGNQELDARYVIRRTMLDSFFRGMAHKGNALTSAVAKESQKWWVTAIRNAEILERIDPHTAKAAAEELRIALESKDDTLKPDQAPVPVQDILH